MSKIYYFILLLIFYAVPAAATEARNKVVVIPLAGDTVTERYTGIPPVVVDNDARTISITPPTPQVPIVFKVRGNGFAVKDLDGGTTIETNIWDLRVYDTRNAFNTSTKRYIVPESGYYYLHAVVRQSNTVTTAFFRISFNVDRGIDFTQVVDGDDTKTNVSGIYFLRAGQEVYVNLRNFSPGTDVRIDGTGSWFEGYKIN